MRPTTFALTLATALLFTACAAGELLDAQTRDTETVDTEPDRSEAEVPATAEDSLSQEELATTFEPDEDWLVSPVLEAKDGATRVGALVELVRAGDPPSIEAQPLIAPDEFGDWVPLSATWGEEDQHVIVADFDGTYGGARIRIAAGDIDRIGALTWSAVTPSEEEDQATADDSLRTTQSPLRSELLSIGVVPREDWDSRATRCSGADASKYRMAIHYTVTPSGNAERRVRSVQAYHQDTRGWCDVGYHFLIGIDGTIYEGRPLQYRGAHVGSNNTGNIGIAFIGCFHPNGCSDWGPSLPPEAMLRSTGALVQRLGALYSIAINGDLILPHRDHSGASTNCPGDHMVARMDDLLSYASGTPPVVVPEPELEPEPEPEPEPRPEPEPELEPEPEPEPDPRPDPDPTPVPEPEPRPTCEPLFDCGTCAAISGCGWCESENRCLSAGSSCAWDGALDDFICWPEFWPCWEATCWNPTTEFPTCGLSTINEDFSSGAYSMHRYWTTLDRGSWELSLTQTAGG
ncbi:MAG: hypothetical protein ACJAYU_005389, partial [Bradymonadia bacterium]